MPGPKELFSFVPTYQTVSEILKDQNLATLGDAYINLIYSIYLSKKAGKPTGAKADSRILAAALKQSGLRKFMASRVNRHQQADAAEAVLVYVWIKGLTTITESVHLMTDCENTCEALSLLLLDAKKKLNLG